MGLFVILLYKTIAMINNNKIIISFLGLALASQACSSPDKKEVRGDSVVTIGKGMEAGRDTGFAAPKNDQNAKSGNASDHTNQSHVDADAAAFMKKAALGGMMEVALGKVAQKSTNPQVSTFAAMMVADHAKANNELKMLADKSEILLPAEYDASQSEHMTKMKSLSGSEFDKHYMAMMVDDHQKTLDLFKAGSETQELDVKKFALKTLPVLEAHYVKAKAIQATLK